MNRNLAIAFLGFCLVIGGFVRAQAQDNAGTMKIAYMDLQRTLSETKVGKAAKKRLESDKKKKQAELNRKQTELKSAADQLEKQRMMLKPDVLKKREQDLNQKYVKLQETYMQLQQGLAAQEAELVKEIFTKAAPIIKSVAEKRGYSVVLNMTAVLWADARYDITKEVNQGLK